MEADRHKIWRIVANNCRSLKQAAPDGYEPAVEVFLVGRPDPVQSGEVQTTRDPSFPWTLLIAETGGGDSPPLPNERLVFAPEQYVERIENHLVRSGERPIGFSHRMLDDPAPTSSNE